MGAWVRAFRTEALVLCEHVLLKKNNVGLSFPSGIFIVKSGKKSN
jgi:hypothetical protein